MLFTLNGTECSPARKVLKERNNPGRIRIKRQANARRHCSSDRSFSYEGVAASFMFYEQQFRQKGIAAIQSKA